MKNTDKSISKDIKVEAVSGISNPVYSGILEGWFSEFNNGMTPILMRVGSRRVYRFQSQRNWEAQQFLKKLRGHYKFFTATALPAIEFLISFFERYPNVSAEDFDKGINAIDQIYDGIGIPRPSERAALTAEIVRQEKKRQSSEMLNLTLAA